MRWIGWFGLGAALTSACIDTQGRYDEFDERAAAKEKRDKQRELEAGVPDPGDCTPITAEALDGKYYFAMVAPTVDIPLISILTLEVTKASAKTLEVDLMLEPTLLKDMKSTFGVMNTGKMTVDVETGVFTTNTFESDVPKEANPILPTATKGFSKLDGTLCWDGEGTLDFICGMLDGMTTEPAEVPLTGTTFGAGRIEGSEFPEVVSSCKGKGKAK